MAVTFVGVTYTPDDAEVERVDVDRIGDQHVHVAVEAAEEGEVGRPAARTSLTDAFDTFTAMTLSLPGVIVAVTSKRKRAKPPRCVPTIVPLT